MSDIEIGCQVEILADKNDAEVRDLFGTDFVGHRGTVTGRSQFSPSAWSVSGTHNHISFMGYVLRRLPDDDESTWLDDALSNPAYDPETDREYKSNPYDVPVKIPETTA